MTSGGLLLDKPVGLSSNAALQRAKRLLGARKAGHAGTLDPLASGLLVLLFGEATKLSGVLLDADKEYLATLKLGERTSTGDAEGDVLERREVPISEPQLREALARFRGEIEQVPPMYSALKRNGVPLYRLARRGEEVERPRRRVMIGLLELLQFRPPLLELRVRCSKGTYVRTLAEDLGRALGSCAHLAALRRTASGRLGVEEAIGLEALEALPASARAARLIPMGGLLKDLPSAVLAEDDEARFRNGQTLRRDGLAPGLCAVYRPSGAVIGLGLADGEGGLRPVRLTAAQAAEKHRETL
jgi:tRNA pseudouridine55 synthase